MSVFDGVESVDLLNRYGSLMERYVKLAQVLAPQLEKFGKYRQELQEITLEFIKRGISPQDSESLVTLIQKELETREIKEDVKIADKSE